MSRERKFVFVTVTWLEQCSQVESSGKEKPEVGCLTLYGYSPEVRCKHGCRSRTIGQHFGDSQICLSTQ
jgi:hypothetical protein